MVAAPLSSEYAHRGHSGVAVGLTVLLMTVTAVVTLPTYPGSAGAYVALHLASAALVGVACLPPVSYGYATLALFLTLGFWLKTVTATMGLPVLIEPTGAFARRPDQWDAALLMVAAGLLGAVLPKGLWFLRSRSAPVSATVPQIPLWYSRFRGAVWLLTIVAIVTSNVLNWIFRFYAVGVHPTLVLPLHLNAIMAWWLTVASGMWLAVLLDWEHRRAPHAPFGRWLLVPAAEALLTTCLVLSRGLYLMKVLPYGLALWTTGARRRFNLSGPVMIGLAGMAVTGFVLSLVVVSWLRLLTYPPTVLADSPQVTSQDAEPAGPPGAREPTSGGPVVPPPPPSPEVRQPSDAEVSATTHQLSRMVLGRWIGLEGVLAVTSSKQPSLALLRQAAHEDPGLGNDALFQEMANAPYRAQPNFTFLTLPGVLAVATYSGSAIVTAACMSVIACLVLVTEAAFRRLFFNDFLCAVVGVAMANALAQMNFPYLTLVFFLEMWATLVGLWLLLSLGPRLPLGRARQSRPATALHEEEV